MKLFEFIYLENMKEELYKKFNVRSTEELFKINKQPENACPVCESFLVKIKEIENTYTFMLEKCNNVEWNMLKNTESEFSEYKFYINQLDIFKEIISENLQQLYDCEEQIEDYRYRCQTIRTNTLNRKKDFWDSMNEIKNDFHAHPVKTTIYDYNEKLRYTIQGFSFQPSESYPIFFEESLRYISIEETIIDITPLKTIFESLVMWQNDLENGYFKFIEASPKSQS